MLCDAQASLLLVYEDAVCIPEFVLLHQPKKWVMTIADSATHYEDHVQQLCKAKSHMHHKVGWP